MCILMDSTADNIFIFLRQSGPQTQYPQSKHPAGQVQDHRKCSRLQSLHIKDGMSLPGTQTCAHPPRNNQEARVDSAPLRPRLTFPPAMLSAQGTRPSELLTLLVFMTSTGLPCPLAGHRLAPDLERTDSSLLAPRPLNLNSHSSLHVQS